MDCISEHGCRLSDSLLSLTANSVKLAILPIIMSALLIARELSVLITRPNRNYLLLLNNFIAVIVFWPTDTGHCAKLDGDSCRVTISAIQNASKDDNWPWKCSISIILNAIVWIFLCWEAAEREEPVMWAASAKPPHSDEHQLAPKFVFMRLTPTSSTQRCRTSEQANKQTSK